MKMNLHPVKAIPIDKQGRSLMKRSIAIVLFPLLLFCTACAHNEKITWARPGASEEDFRQDLYRCTIETQQSGFIGGAGPIGMGAANQVRIQRIKKEHDLSKMCMQAHGYVITKIERTRGPKEDQLGNDDSR